MSTHIIDPKSTEPQDIGPCLNDIQLPARERGQRATKSLGNLNISLSAYTSHRFTSGDSSIQRTIAGRAVSIWGAHKVSVTHNRAMGSLNPNVKPIIPHPTVWTQAKGKML